VVRGGRFPRTEHTIRGYGGSSDRSYRVQANESEVIVYHSSRTFSLSESLMGPYIGVSSIRQKNFSESLLPFRQMASTCASYHCSRFD
jgi:hypothetical protein